jgi:hypothetical protein
MCNGQVTEGYSLMPKTRKSSLSASATGVFWILMCMPVLSLQIPAKLYLEPYVPFLTLGLQICIPFITIINTRIKPSGDFSHLYPLFSILLALFFWSIFSGLWSMFPSLVIQRSLLVWVPLLLLILVVWSDPNPIDSFRKISLGWVAFVFLLSIIAVFLFFFGTLIIQEDYSVQQFTLGPLTLAQCVMGIPPLRVCSLTSNPNVFASWILFAVPLTLYLRNIKQLNRFVAAIVTLFLLVALLLTMSRTGIIITLMSIATYFFFSTTNINYRVFRFLLILIILISIAIGASQLSVLKSDFVLESERFSLDLNSRDIITSILVDSLIKNSILFGVGFGVASEAVLQPAGMEFSSHNAHLQLLVETGLIGYSLFFVAYLSGLFSAIRALRLFKGDLRFLLSALVSIQFTLFFHQVFEGSFLRYDFSTLFWGYILALSSYVYVTRMNLLDSLLNTNRDG